jgi:hypothetical protein
MTVSGAAAGVVAGDVAHARAGFGAAAGLVCARGRNSLSRSGRPTLGATVGEGVTGGRVGAAGLREASTRDGAVGGGTATGCHGLRAGLGGAGCVRPAEGGVARPRSGGEDDATLNGEGAPDGCCCCCAGKGFQAGEGALMGVVCGDDAAATDGSRRARADLCSSNALCGTNVTSRRGAARRTHRACRTAMDAADGVGTSFHAVLREAPGALAGVGCACGGRAGSRSSAAPRLELRGCGGGGVSAGAAGRAAEVPAPVATS